jgi:hypothetical protein
MPLFELTPTNLVEIPTTTFAAEQVLERPDLQRHLRNRIKIRLNPDHSGPFRPCLGSMSRQGAVL